METQQNIKDPYKIGIVGYGYWGKIIFKNLVEMYYENPLIYDFNPSPYEHLNVKSYDELLEKCNYIIITTPVITHYDLVKRALEKNKKVFCEKVLTDTLFGAKNLYKIQSLNSLKRRLFVDWTFTYNPGLLFIKKRFENGNFGPLLNATLNRLNINHSHVVDVNARLDMASHDVAALLFLTKEMPIRWDWYDYTKNRNNNLSDSTLGILNFEKFTATINASWKYAKKYRECAFEFKDVYVLWNDVESKVELYNKSGLLMECFSYKPSDPIINCLKSFIALSNEQQLEQQQLTMDTLAIILNKNNTINDFIQRELIKL